MCEVFGGYVSGGWNKWCGVVLYIDCGWGGEVWEEWLISGGVWKVECVGIDEVI